MKKITKSIVSLMFVMCAILGTVISSPAVAHAADTSISARSTVAQTVMLGPSSSIYASAGSIGQNEKITILGKVKNMDWYHIQYTVSSSGNFKTGYVPTSKVTGITGGTPQDEIYNGGQRVANSTTTVYSCDNIGRSVKIGTIYANEGLTELYGYSILSTKVSYVEFATPSGTKRGYAFNPNFSNSMDASVSSVARVKNNATLYYGMSTSSYNAAGSVYAGEFVTVLAKNGDWVYVEYNTSAGKRKRGYFSVGQLDLHRPGLTYRDIYSYDYNPHESTAMANLIIYSGPSTQYANLLTMPNGSCYYLYHSIGNWHYIEYKVNGKRTSGWIYCQY